MFKPQFCVLFVMHFEKVLDIFYLAAVVLIEDLLSLNFKASNNKASLVRKLAQASSSKGSLILKLGKAKIRRLSSVLNNNSPTNSVLKRKGRARARASLVNRINSNLDKGSSILTSLIEHRSSVQDLSNQILEDSNK